MQFPYAVYLCHIAHQSGYRAYKVSLTALRDGSALSMSAFCHLDTAGWNPAHPAFEVLHTKPGGTPVCHFMPYGNMVLYQLSIVILLAGCSIGAYLVSDWHTTNLKGAKVMHWS
ncbi:hypothetical protein EJB05_53494, partial [Eragrostis curvula]